MKKPVNNKTFRVAFCAIIAALSVVIMLFSSLVPIGVFALPCIAGAFLVSVVIEYGAKWALGVFVVSAALSLFLAGDKEAALYFAMFFGYYPIVKQLVESRVRPKVISFLIKFAVFNFAMVAAFFIAEKLLAVSPDEYTVFGMYVPYLFLLAGNLFFILYDRALTLFAVFYVRVIRTKLFR